MPFDPIPIALEMRWMDVRRAGGAASSGTGHFLTGWEDQIWILHAMWENPQIPDALTYADADQILSDLGERPRIVTDVDDLVATELFAGEVRFGFDTGGGWGLTVPPDAPWTRLTWHDYMERNGIVPDTEFIPCSRWLGWDFRTNVEPPGEGSLDLAQLITLEKILLHNESKRDPHTSANVFAWFSFFAPVQPQWVEPEVSPNLDGQLFRGPLDELAAFSIAMECAPNNVWPDDRSWMITTDADAWGTLLQGPAGLVERVRASSTDLDLFEKRFCLEVHETVDSRLTPHTPPPAP